VQSTSRRPGNEPRIRRVIDSRDSGSPLHGIVHRYQRLGSQEPVPERPRCNRKSRNIRISLQQTGTHMGQLQATETRARKCQGVDRLVAAFRGGQIVVNAEGQVLWVDASTRRRLNGELKHLDLSAAASAPSALNCRAAPLDLTIHGQRVTVCVIQEHTSADEAAAKDSNDLLAAVEAVMADSASWFTRTILEKIKSLRKTQSAGREASPSDLDVLSERERDVLGFICEGRRDAQMGEAMGVSRNTVRNHIASLYRKIGVNRRSAVLIWARDRGVTGCVGLPKKLRRSSSAAHRKMQNDGSRVSY
jgi:DNA-binding NarL/FixJ family response regulator